MFLVHIPGGPRFLLFERPCRSLSTMSLEGVHQLNGLPQAVIQNNGSKLPHIPRLLNDTLWMSEFYLPRIQSLRL